MSQFLIQSINSSQAIWPWVAGITLRGTVLLLMTLAAVFALKRSSAALRHLAWASGIAALVLLPLLTAAVPAWRVLPRWVADATLIPDATLAPPVTKVEDRAEVFVPATESLSWQGCVAAIWLIGIAAMLARFALLELLAYRTLRHGVEIENPLGMRLMNRIRRCLGIRRDVRLLGIRAISVPMTVGMVRPRVLVPLESSTWPTSRWRVVLLHELAHVLRWDTATDLLARGALALFWFHPLAHIARRQMIIEQERACDDLVLQAGVSGTTYADELLQAAALAQRGCGGLQTVGLSMARISTLEARLRAVLSGGCPRGQMTLPAVLCGILLAAMLAWPIAAMSAVEEFSPTAPSSVVASVTVDQSEYEVLGDVERPGVFKMNGGKITVEQALAAAGVRDPNSPELVITFVKRIEGKLQPRMTIPYNVNRAIKARAIEPNDIMVVEKDPQLLEKMQAAREFAERAAQAAERAHAAAEHARMLQPKLDALQRQLQELQAKNPQLGVGGANPAPRNVGR